MWVIETANHFDPSESCSDSCSCWHWERVDTNSFLSRMLLRLWLCQKRKWIGLSQLGILHITLSQNSATGVLARFLSCLGSIALAHTTTGILWVETRICWRFQRIYWKRRCSVPILMWEALLSSQRNGLKSERTNLLVYELWLICRCHLMISIRTWEHSSDLVRIPSYLQSIQSTTPPLMMPILRWWNWKSRTNARSPTSCQILHVVVRLSFDCSIVAGLFSSCRRLKWEQRFFCHKVGPVLHDGERRQRVCHNSQETYGTHG